MKLKYGILIGLFILSNQTFASEHAVVLAYHGISSVPNSMNTSLKTFTEQMNFLKDNHYNIISSEQLVNAIQYKKSLPERAVVLTFDDGWKNQNQAMALLNQYHFPATFGLVTIFQKYNLSIDLQKSDFEQYKKAPFVYINHSFTHDEKKFLVNPEYDTTQSEIVLKQLFGSYLPYYIYPYGKKNAKLITVLKKYGYIAAFDVQPNLVDINKTDLYRIPRYLIHEKTSIEQFKSIVSTGKF